MKILLVVYDNGSHIHWFPQGLSYIASSLLNSDHDVEIYNQDIHHYKEEHLTEYLNNNKFDIIGVSVIGGYYQYRKLLSISNAINKSKNRPFFIIGGHGPSPEPKFFLTKTKADAIVIGEGEITVCDLLNNLDNLSSVKGIAYRKGNEVFVNERRELIKDVDSISWPAYKLFPIEYYRLFQMGSRLSITEFTMPMLSGRGCKFRCNFCYRLDKGFRPRSAESIIEEVQYLKKTYSISSIIFSDELLMSSVKRTTDLCEKFISSELNINWFCNGRLNYAEPSLLKLMKKAGCVFINYGIESMDDATLEIMNKHLTTDQIIKGVENTSKVGIDMGLNIIFGNINETKEALWKGVEFLKKYDDASKLRVIRPVTPYPGSDLYYHAIENGMLKDCEDFYENKHTNSDLMSVNFTNMPDDEVYKELTNANKELVASYYSKKCVESLESIDNLYGKRDSNFRGFRRV